MPSAPDALPSFPDLGLDVFHGDLIQAGLQSPVLILTQGQDRRETLRKVKDRRPIVGRHLEQNELPIPAREQQRLGGGFSAERLGPFALEISQWNSPHDATSVFIVAVLTTSLVRIIHDSVIGCGGQRRGALPRSTQLAGVPRVTLVGLRIEA
jgi:hypothetical protein